MRPLRPTRSGWGRRPRELGRQRRNLLQHNPTRYVSPLSHTIRRVGGVSSFTVLASPASILLTILRSQSPVPLLRHDEAKLLSKSSTMARSGQRELGPSQYALGGNRRLAFRNFPSKPDGRLESALTVATQCAVQQDNFSRVDSWLSRPYTAAQDALATPTCPGKSDDFSHGSAAFPCSRDAQACRPGMCSTADIQQQHRQGRSIGPVRRGQRPVPGEPDGRWGNDLYDGTAVHASVASASGICDARRLIEEVRSMAGCCERDRQRKSRSTMLIRKFFEPTAMHSWIAHEDIVRSDSGTRRQQVPSADRQNGSLATSDRVGTVNPYRHESHSETKLATFSGRP